MKLRHGLAVVEFLLNGVFGDKTAIIVSLCLLIGCRQLVGIEERQAFDAGAPEKIVLACGLPNRGAVCASCVAKNCCAQAEQCLNDSACRNSEQCVATCASGDSVCELLCPKQWIPVTTLQGQIQDCRSASCSDACGPWDCLGSVNWKVPDPIKSPINIYATAIGGADANAGVHVRVCSIAYPTCDSELASSDTDSNGNVTLTFNSTGSPMPVYLEFHKDGWVDDLLMLDAPPLSFDFNVGNVVMDDTDSVKQLALNLATTYDSNLATVKLRVSDCNLQPSDAIDVTVDDLTIDPTFGMSGEHIAVNLPIPENRLARVEARLKDPAAAAPQDPTTEPLIADANLVLRAGAITLAPFIAPTPH